jgi:hypothetical protein
VPVMDTTRDIHSTARAFFHVMIVNCAAPDTITGGKLDGLRYFVVEIDGEDYCLTEHGLFTPSIRGPHQPRRGAPPEKDWDRPRGSMR